MTCQHSFSHEPKNWSVQRMNSGFDSRSQNWRSWSLLPCMHFPTNEIWFVQQINIGFNGPKSKNGCWINFLVFKLKLASLEIRYSLEFCTLKKTASKANFNWNKKILTQQPFLHWVYSWPQNWRSLSLRTSMYLVPRWCLCLFIANSLCSPFSNLMKASPFLLPWAFKQKAIPPLE